MKLLPETWICEAENIHKNTRPKRFISVHLNVNH